MYWKWLILVQHNKTKHKSVMGSQNLKENNFETEDSFHFWYVTTLGNQFPTFWDNYIVFKSGTNYLMLWVHIPVERNP